MVSLLFVCGAVPWLFFPLREGSHLEYRSGVSFDAAYKEEYKIIKWYSTNVNDPEPCPFVVVLPDQEYDEKHLADFERLKNEGWIAGVSDGGEVELYTHERLFRCWFREKRLVHVEVNLTDVKCKPDLSIGIKVFGKSVRLPASEQQIVNILGPPKRKRRSVQKLCRTEMAGYAGLEVGTVGIECLAIST
jgi:hypothetical protein